jgi:hypothetical protein
MFPALYYIMSEVRKTINGLSSYLLSYLFLPETMLLLQVNQHRVYAYWASHLDSIMMYNIFKILHIGEVRQT